MEALEPLVAAQAEMIPELRVELAEAAERLARAQADGERLEALKVQHAGPVLLEVDAKLVPARAESEVVLDRLRQTFGFDERSARRSSSALLQRSISLHFTDATSTWRPELMRLPLH